MGKSFFSDAEKRSLRQIALEEVEELVEQIEASSTELEAGVRIPENMTSVKRYFHTIGGSAGLAGLKEISALGVEGEIMMEAAERAGQDAPGDILSRIRNLAQIIAEKAGQAARPES
jgi:chemotaxis protein histidine kinase CheA